jgi:hypothetical protein
VTAIRTLELRWPGHIPIVSLAHNHGTKRLWESPGTLCPSFAIFCSHRNGCNWMGLDFIINNSLSYQWEAFQIVSGIVGSRGSDLVVTVLKLRCKTDRCVGAVWHWMRLFKSASWKRYFYCYLYY